MAQNLDHGYSAKIFTQGSAWSLRINDLFVRENVDVAYATSNGSISTEVQPGTNTLTLDFSPITGRDQATGAYTYELRDGISIEIALERRDFATQQSTEIHPIHLVYRAEEQAFVPVPNTTDGTARVLENGTLRTFGTFEISEITDQPMVLRSGQKIGGYRLELEFQIADEELPPFHWTADAVQLSDTPQMRDELLAAYKDVHALMAAGDAEAIFKMAEPVWARTAFLLTSKPDARAFIEGSDLGLAGRYAPVRRDGAVLQPLAFWGDHRDAAVQFMANNHLVRFRPDPVIWEKPPEGSGNRSAFPIVFYKTKDGDWRLANIASGI